MIRPFWQSCPNPTLPTLGTQLGNYRVIASKPGAILLLFCIDEYSKEVETQKGSVKFKLTTEQSAMLWRAINKGFSMKLLPLYHSADHSNFLRRARRAMVKAIAEPGDCAGDLPFLACLSAAEAEIGHGAGWIPEVQRIAYSIVSSPGF